MKIKIPTIGSILACSIVFTSCGLLPSKHTTLNKEKQSSLSPADVLNDFKRGNERYAQGNQTKHNYPKQIRSTEKGQFPKAVVLSCMDSRVPVENVFDQGIGDIFVTRLAGNLVNTDVLGGMEYACQVAGAKLIFVMGHESCGAVKGAIDDVKLGNVTSLLSKIKPAVRMSHNFKGHHDSHNHEYVSQVAENNVRYSINQVRKQSPILRGLEKSGKIKIVGGFYRLSDGRVNFID